MAAAADRWMKLAAEAKAAGDPDKERYYREQAGFSASGEASEYDFDHGNDEPTPGV